MSIGTAEFTQLRDSTPIFSPSMQPERFVACVDNPHFPLIPGTVYRFEEQTRRGTETVTVTVTDQTRDILGIKATVVHDVVHRNGKVREDTWDWYAQDDRGNVWYLGEDTKAYLIGNVAITAGSWEAGVDGAMAGLIMPGDPRPGDIYYQEYYKGHAEDMGAIVSLSETVETAVGSFDRTLQTADYNPLDKQLEHKWYAPGVGLVKETVVGGSARVDLVSISHDSAMAVPDRGCGRNGGVSKVDATH